ncbi:MAG: N-acetylmuramoyl-L-alanine amidase [Arenimonas sp.]
MEQKIIILTAGHGGANPGAVSLDGKFIEGREAVRLRDSVAKRLRDAGAPVITDGNAGQNQPLADALKLIGRPGLLPLEIHFNAGPESATGVEVLALPGWAKASRAIARTVAETLGLPLRGDGGWKPDNAGQHHRLAWCRRGGLLLEVCFLSNPGDLLAYTANFTALCDRLAHLLDVLSKGEKP